MTTLDVSSSNWMMYVTDDMKVSASKYCDSQKSLIEGKCVPCPENYGTLFFQQSECMSCNEMIQYDITGNMDYQTYVAT